MLAVMLVLQSNYMVFASEPKMKGGERLKEIIMEQENGSISGSSIERLVDVEQVESEQRAILDNHKVMEIVGTKERKSNRVGYVDYYGGSYINEEGKLVVQLCDATKIQQQSIEEAAGDTVIFEEVENSYESLTSEIEKSSALLTELEEQNVAGELSGDLKKLADSMVGMCTNVKENINTVYMTDISEEMQTAYMKYFGDSHVMFEQSEQAETTAVTISPGAKIGVNDVYLSLGTRMEYDRNNGNTVRGFITAGHGTKAYGDLVYFVKANGTYVEIGKVIKRQFSGSVDMSFVQMTNSNYDVSRYTKYINASGATGESYKMCTTCAYADKPSIGQTIYKSGATTYLTSSQIASTNYTVTYSKEGVTLTNMILSTTRFCDFGDSGSSVFTKENGSVFETIGVMSGKGDNCSFISNIQVADNKWENTQGLPLFQY